MNSSEILDGLLCIIKKVANLGSWQEVYDYSEFTRNAMDYLKAEVEESIKDDYEGPWLEAGLWDWCDPTKPQNQDEDSDDLY